MDIAAVAEVSDAVGHLSYFSDWDVFYKQAAKDKANFYIKTHDVPQDEGKAIYIVRHPYQAAQSYMDYLNRVAGQQVDLIDAICGIHSPFPSWGAHLDSWNPLERKDILLLKYEDLLSDADNQIARIEDFLKIRRLHTWENSFGDLREAMPVFFRKGEAACAQADPRYSRLIRLFYGDWMDRLGYSDPVEMTDQGWTDLLAEVALRYLEEVQNLHEKIQRREANATECRRWAEVAEEKFKNQRDLAASYLAMIKQSAGNIPT